MGAPMPKALVGGVAQTPDGQRICFGFNLGTCREAVRDAMYSGKPCKVCVKGLHVCTKPGCHGPHPVHDCSM